MMDFVIDFVINFSLSFLGVIGFYKYIFPSLNRNPNNGEGVENQRVLTVNEGFFLSLMTVFITMPFVFFYLKTYNFEQRLNVFCYFSPLLFLLALFAADMLKKALKLQKGIIAYILFSILSALYFKFLHDPKAHGLGKTELLVLCVLLLPVYWSVIKIYFWKTHDDG